MLSEAEGEPPDQVDAQEAYIRKLIGLLRAEDYAAAEALIRTRLEALPEAQRPTPQQIEATARIQATPSMRSFVAYSVSGWPTNR